MKYLITGKNGMLAKEFQKSDFFADNESFSHKELDITDKNKLYELINEVSPNVVINCAAFTDVTFAEVDYVTAYETNVLGVSNIAEVTAKKNILFINFSTDYVFDGKEKKSFSENDKRIPVNKYGLSKKLGEDELFYIRPNFLNIRISWLYGDEGKNFFSKVKFFLESKSELNIVADQIGRTTYVKDVVDVTEWLIKNRKRGVYHFADKGEISRYDFAVKVKEILEINNNLSYANLNPIKSSEYHDKTPRPFCSVLNTDKIESEGYKIRSWEEALKDFISI